MPVVPKPRSPVPAKTNGKTNVSRRRWRFGRRTPSPTPTLQTPSTNRGHQPSRARLARLRLWRGKQGKNLCPPQGSLSLRGLLSGSVTTAPRAERSARRPSVRGTARFGGSRTRRPKPQHERRITSTPVVHSRDHHGGHPARGPWVKGHPAGRVPALLALR